jgi:hypothetical protein
MEGSGLSAGIGSQVGTSVGMRPIRPPNSCLGGVGRRVAITVGARTIPPAGVGGSNPAAVLEVGMRVVEASGLAAGIGCQVGP